MRCTENSDEVLPMLCIKVSRNDLSYMLGTSIMTIEHELQSMFVHILRKKMCHYLQLLVKVML